MVQRCPHLLHWVGERARTVLSRSLVLRALTGTSVHSGHMELGMTASRTHLPLPPTPSLPVLLYPQHEATLLSKLDDLTLGLGLSRQQLLGAVLAYPRLLQSAPDTVLARVALLQAELRLPLKVATAMVAAQVGEGGRQAGGAMRLRSGVGRQELSGPPPCRSSSRSRRGLGRQHGSMRVRLHVGSVSSFDAARSCSKHLCTLKPPNLPLPAASDPPRAANSACPHSRHWCACRRRRCACGRTCCMRQPACCRSGEGWGQGLRGENCLEYVLRHTGFECCVVASTAMCATPLILLRPARRHELSEMAPGTLGRMLRCSEEVLNRLTYTYLRVSTNGKKFHDIRLACGWGVEPPLPDVLDILVSADTGV
mgnify:CR=1 FL=1